MPSASRYILYSLLGLATAGGTLSAQDTQPTDWLPVDQTVSDLDLRAASLRRVEQGIGVYGQSGSLYRRADTGYMGQGQPLSQAYQLRQPGYTAYIDQPDYLVIGREGEVLLNVSPSEDGHFQNLIPPNTVFDLIYRPPAPVTQSDGIYSGDWIDPALSTRIDGTIGGVVTGGSTIRELPPPPIAHRLPAHLIKAREERKAEALREAEAGEEGSAIVEEPSETDGEGSSTVSE